MSTPLRVLVVDDSAYNRRTIGKMLSSIPGVTLAGKAVDGDEALKLVEELQPDVITLDLNMPRMDGFKFLRILMARRPVPVIVVSGYAEQENVFRALELGALDFVAKPMPTATTALHSIQDELAAKMRLVAEHLNRTPAAASSQVLGHGSTATGVFRNIPPSARGMVAATPQEAEPGTLVTIGASTGGPTALVEIFARLPPTAAVVVAQHMPERFTYTFAQRLDRLSQLTVREAAGVQRIHAGTAWICPGGRCIEIHRRNEELVLEVRDPAESDRYVPSADRLFLSAAEAAGKRCVSVVLTGMGNDGAQGLTAVRQHGGTVWAESPETAILPGMPNAATYTGLVDYTFPLSELAERLVERVK